MTKIKKKKATSARSTCAGFPVEVHVRHKNDSFSFLSFLSFFSVCGQCAMHANDTRQSASEAYITYHAQISVWYIYLLPFLLLLLLLQTNVDVNALPPGHTCVSLPRGRGMHRKVLEKKRKKINIPRRDMSTYRCGYMPRICRRVGYTLSIQW